MFSSMCGGKDMIDPPIHIRVLSVVSTSRRGYRPLYRSTALGEITLFQECGNWPLRCPGCINNSCRRTAKLAPPLFCPSRMVRTRDCNALSNVPPQVVDTALCWRSRASCRQIRNFARVLWAHDGFFQAMSLTTRMCRTELSRNQNSSRRRSNTSNEEPTLGNKCDRPNAATAMSVPTAQPIVVTACDTSSSQRFSNEAVGKKTGSKSRQWHSRMSDVRDTARAYHELSGELHSQGVLVTRKRQGCVEAC